MEELAALQEGTAEGRGKLGFSGTETCLLWLEFKVYIVYTAWRWETLAGGDLKGSTGHHKGPWLGPHGHMREIWRNEAGVPTAAYPWAGDLLLGKRGEALSSSPGSGKGEWSSRSQHTLPGRR